MELEITAMEDFKGTKTKEGESKWIRSGMGFQVLTADSYYSVCEAVGKRGAEEQIANAQLIATAPELLEALIRLKKMYQDLESTLYGKNMTVNNWHLNGDVEHIDNFFEDLDLDAIGFSETIIAKALGREAQP